RSTKTTSLLPSGNCRRGASPADERAGGLGCEALALIARVEDEPDLRGLVTLAHPPEREVADRCSGRALDDGCGQPVSFGGPGDVAHPLREEIQSLVLGQHLSVEVANDLWVRPHRVHRLEVVGKERAHGQAARLEGPVWRHSETLPRPAAEL